MLDWLVDLILVAIGSTADSTTAEGAWKRLRVAVKRRFGRNSGSPKA